jgi:hypothetical protein
MVTSTSQISFRERMLQSSKRLYNEAEGICVDRTMSELSNQKVTISNTTCEKQF